MKRPQQCEVTKLYKTYKKSALVRNLPMEISFDEFHSHIRSPCAYCNFLPKHFNKYNGLDRINNNFGYIRLNIVPCCAICNKAKFTLLPRQFEDWIDRFRPKKPTEEFSLKEMLKILKIKILNEYIDAYGQKEACRILKISPRARRYTIKKYKDLKLIK